MSRPQSLHNAMESVVFKTKEVTDLSWIIGSKVLMQTPVNWGSTRFLDDAWCSEQWNLHKNWLIELDEQPRLLLENLSNNPTHLIGKYVENLMYFWFTHSPYFELMYTNVQLASGSVTIGEADCLVRDLSSGVLIHLELACKYFLGKDKSSSWSYWIGPNSHDSLEERMGSFKRQCALFDTPEGKDFLADHRLEIPESVIFFKGYFMQHFSRLGMSAMPKFSNSHCNGGWYLKQAELSTIATEYSQWVALTRSQWLAPLHAALDSVEVMSGIRLKERATEWFKNSDYAMLIVQVEEKDGRVAEMSRGFIVADKWG